MGCGRADELLRSRLTAQFALFYSMPPTGSIP